MNSFAAIFLLYAELVLALMLLWKDGLLKDRRAQVISLLLVTGVFLLRYFCMENETGDYQDWVSRWVTHFRENGAWTGLGQEIWACNYNVPYLYPLALFSLSDIRDLYLIKLLSILFDVLMAWWVLKLVSLFTQSTARRLTAFIGTLWLPTVVLNGAYWGQCDSLYGSLAILSLYLALSDRPWASVAAIAVSFSLKLQAVFMMPVFLVFIIARKMKFKHLLLFPVVYILTILPAVLAGRSFKDLLLFYLNNADTAGASLNYNSSSLFSLLEVAESNESLAALVGIGAAFALCLGVFAWTFVNRDRLNNRVILGAALVLCLGVPYFLPHMHDRYFFLADVLSFALAAAFPWEALIPALVSFGSLLGYHAYLRARFLVSMRNGGLVNGLALVLSVVFMACQFEKNEKSKLTNQSNLL